MCYKFMHRQQSMSLYWLLFSQWKTHVTFYKNVYFKDESMSKIWKVITLEVKFKSNVNGIKEKFNHGNVDTATIWQTLDKQPEEFMKGNMINKKSGCDNSDEHVPEEVILVKTSPHKNSQRYFMTLKTQRIKCWKLIET